MSNDEIFMNNFFCIKRLFSSNEIVYISTPINTGERFISWHKAIGRNLDINGSEYAEEFAKNVFEPNIKYAKKCIDKIKKSANKVIIDSVTIENETLNCTQEEFYLFLDKIIKELINKVIFLDGWEYSVGCCHELLSAVKYNRDIYSQDMKKLCFYEVINKMYISANIYESININISKRIRIIIDEIQMLSDKYYNINNLINSSSYMKDDKLDFIISNDIGNIAQFVSFEPKNELVPKYIHINNFSYNEKLNGKDIIERLILSAPSRLVNIRSYSPQVMKGNKLIFNKGLQDIDEILNIINENSLAGKSSIVNENLPVDDSGVSGVVLGNTIEFAPEDTPKCVDKEGVCSLPREIGLKLLKIVYGFEPSLNFEHNFRVEFSIHPKRQGVKKQHTIIWEYEYFDKVNDDKKIKWPNRFSNFLGDKLFGLLIADALGILVPKTTVISRKVAPFSFGVETGLIEKWIRTCPITKEPGKYYTGRNWSDPFRLMNIEETKGNDEINIASILSQDEVEAVYSGASIVTSDINRDIIEGVSGRGDDFMVGKQGREDLPDEVVESIYSLHDSIRMYYKELGDVSIEWVYDGSNVWLVQLNQIKVNSDYDKSNSCTIVEGNPSYYEKVYVEDGLDSLRDKIKQYENKDIGIELIGDVGITSHFGDILRLANIPSVLTRIVDK